MPVFSPPTRLMASLNLVVSVLFFSFSLFSFEIEGQPNYGDALAKSILFFEGQRSGRIPSGQKISWRTNSGLSDGSAEYSIQPSQKAELLLPLCLASCCQETTQAGQENSFPLSQSFHQTPCKSTSVPLMTKSKKSTLESISKSDSHEYLILSSSPKSKTQFSLKSQTLHRPPKMPISKLLVASLLLISLSFAHSWPPTAYELLERYNLPRGLLPEGVESFLLQTDGSFDVYFDGECEFEVEGKYLFRYKRRISGKIEDGAIKSLDGVSVKFLFIWLGIGKIVRVDDELRFYVGFVSASFPVASFEDCPKCRWGFNCGSSAAEELDVGDQ